MAVQRRKNERALIGARATGIGLTTAVGLAGMTATPAWLPFAVGLVAGAVALVSSELGVLIGVIALSVPVIAVQPVLGFTVLIALVACVRLLGAEGGRGFILLGLALIGAFLGPVWAAAALAGYLFGAGEGALFAAMACIIVEIVGLALGKPSIGVTATGGSGDAIVSFAKMPETLLSASWVAKSFTSIDGAAVTSTLDGFTEVKQPLMLFLQPWLWALGAVATGMIAEAARKQRNLGLSIAAVSAGVAVPAAGTIALGIVLGSPLHWGWVALALFSSLAVAVVFTVIWERVFPPVRVVAKVPPKKASMATEDADVDELLRLIATAEDKLATNHTSVRVVMITDMKSFSRMTEEDGSVATAKAIQRHRDLLLPVIQRHNGSGKSTGGDGLVAAFESPTDALLAAVDMQHALSAHNAAHPDEREIWVRAGLASGEVVLDKGGRPFIGAGLNLAARVMNLADGGQVFSTADVADAAAAVKIRTVSFGDFELKNIARPVEIVEVLWEDGQEAQDPRGLGGAAYGALEE